MSVPAHLTPLRLAQRFSLDLVSGCQPPWAADVSWLGTEIEGAQPGMRRFLTDLSLPVRGGSYEVQFKKAAYVDIGEFQATTDGCEVEVGWRSSSLAPLFPVFAGRLRLSRNEIVLEGFYAPPGGQVGVVLDRAFLNIAARGTARWFLERLAAELAGQRETAGRPSISAQAKPAGGRVGP